MFQKFNKLFSQKIFSKKVFLIISIWAAATVSIVGMQYLIAAYAGPTSAPPDSTLSGGQYLTTGDDNQTKLGSLTIDSGDPSSPSSLTVVGNIAASSFSSPDIAYFPDVFLNNTGRLASEPKITYNKCCQSVSSGDCEDVQLNSADCDIAETADDGDNFLYVVRGIDSDGHIICCRPPKSSETFTSPFPLKVTVSVDASVRCTAMGDKYKGIATITVTNATDPSVLVNGAVVYGYWRKSGADLACGTTPCRSPATGSSAYGYSNGVTTISSAEVDDVNAYGETFTFTVTGVSHAVGYSDAGTLPEDPAEVIIDNPSEPIKYTHVGSVEVEYQLIGNWSYTATATVKVVNEAGVAIPESRVYGYWSDSINPPYTAAGQTVDENGETVFTTPYSVWSWNVLPYPGTPRFTFTVTGVEPGMDCSAYIQSENEENLPDCGLANNACSYVAVGYKAYPDSFGWGFEEPNKKYAWGENIGWINFQPSNGGVLVWTNCLEGYIWAENVGWINVGDGSPQSYANCGMDYGYSNGSSTDFGVNYNKNTGHLSGYAWGENIGWINFDPPSGGGVTLAKIDETTLRFDGKAWAENVGWINFDLEDGGQSTYIATSVGD